MGGGCKETGIILGDAGFSKTMVGDSFSIYVSHAVRSWISYEIRAKEPPEQCMRDGEEVLATITLRPERGCSDRAEFVANITIPDNAAIPAGTTSSCSGPNSTSYILNPDNIKIRSEP
jgi:hypothetical protein